MTTGKPTGRSRQRRPDPAEDRRLGRAMLAIIASWSLIVLYVVHGQLPDNALTLPGGDRVQNSLRQVTPQGWAFFTKSPRDPQLVVWQPNAGDQWELAMLAPHGEPRNIFGLNRRSRAQPVEMAVLAQSAPSEHWQDCDDGDIPACLAATLPVPVENPAPEPLICGPVGLSQQEPVPWAWAGSDTRMPATVLHLEVQC